MEGFEHLRVSDLGILVLLCGLVALFGWCYLSGTIWTSLDLSLESPYKEFYFMIFVFLFFDIQFLLLLHQPVLFL